MKIEIKKPKSKPAKLPDTGLLTDITDPDGEGEIILRIRKSSTVVVLRASKVNENIAVPYSTTRMDLESRENYIPYNGPITLSNE